MSCDHSRMDDREAGLLFSFSPSALSQQMPGQQDAKMADDTRTPTRSAVKDVLRGLSRPENTTAPVTPPNRFNSSTYSTPGSTYGKEEDAIIVELNPRWLLAGIEGESSPQCRIVFKPDNSRRVNDYRARLPSYKKRSEDVETWSQGYELFRNDLKDVDLALLSDMLERAMREAYNNYLLIDAGSARLVLVVPSLLAHPVLETVLQTLFDRWNYSTITLLPTPACTLVSAGLRSGLVVEIGWEETTVTALYEFREIKVVRSVRGMKRLTIALGEMIKQHLSTKHRFDLEFIEQTIRRILPYALDTIDGPETDNDAEVNQFNIDWPAENLSTNVTIPVKDIVAATTDCFLDSDKDQHQDDNELPITQLIYMALLGLSNDTRATCISRIVFPDAVTGLSTFINQAFQQYLNQRGWNEVRGTVTKARKPLSEVSQARTGTIATNHDDVVWQYKESGVAIDEERYLREKDKQKQSSVHGVVRVVESLGPWAGASLLTSLNIKSFVEIQRERFLNHGLAGASRDADISVVPQQRMSSLATRNKPTERNSWTLSGWA